MSPPTIAIGFNPNPIALNATTSLTFTIVNPAANSVTLTGIGFTDTLPVGLSVPNASATVCGGTVTLVSPSSISMTGASILANGQCVFSVTVTGLVVGQYIDSTSAITSTNGGTGNTASAGLTVASAPTTAMTFAPTSIPLSGTSTLTLTLHNANSAAVLHGLAFTDSLPAGLAVAASNNLSNSCGGAVLANAGATSITLSSGVLAASASCAVQVDVVGNTAGIKNNSTVSTSTEGGTGNVANASVTVVAPPVLIQAFGVGSIPLGGSTTLKFIVQNNNASATLHGITFSETLPAGLVIATPNGVSNTCAGATIGATAGSGAINFSGGTIGALGSCSFVLNVTGTAAGLQNSLTGNIGSIEGGTGGTAATALIVEAPPTIAIAFNPTAIATGATTSLTFTIVNPAANAVALTGIAFSDSLPAGLSVPNASATVCGGTVTLTAPSTISLSGATIAAHNQCIFSVTTTGNVSGNYIDSTNLVVSNNGGTGNSASANLAVGTPASLSLSVNDSRGYARYGGLRDYLVTVTNSGGLPVNDVALASGVNAADATPTSWQCLGGCGSASGALNLNSQIVPGNASTVWVATVSVQAAAPDPNLTYSIVLNSSAAPLPLSGSDTDALVIFRDSFDVANGDGAQLAPLAPQQTLSVDEPDAIDTSAPFGTLTSGTTADGARFRVDRLDAQGKRWVRLVAISPQGRETATPWQAHVVGQPLSVGFTGGGEKPSLVLVAGAEQDL